MGKALEDRLKELEIQNISNYDQHPSPVSTFSFNISLEDRLKELELQNLSNYDHHSSPVPTDSEASAQAGRVESQLPSENTTATEDFTSMKEQLTLLNISKALDNFEMKVVDDRSKEGKDVDDWDVCLVEDAGYISAHNKNEAGTKWDGEHFLNELVPIATERGIASEEDIPTNDDEPLECLVQRLFKRRREGRSDQSVLSVHKEPVEKMEGGSELSEEERKLCRDAFVQMKGSNKISQLMVESRLVEIDEDIQASLNMSNMQARMTKCSELVSDLLKLEVTDLMLKKQPNIVMTMRKSKDYFCLQKEKDNEGERNQMVEEVKLFNTRIEACFEKFLNLFPGYEDSGETIFLNYFQKQVEMFRSKTEEWNEIRVVSLTEWDSLDQSEENVCDVQINNC